MIEGSTKATYQIHMRRVSVQISFVVQIIKMIIIRVNLYANNNWIVQSHATQRLIFQLHLILLDDSKTILKNKSNPV